MQLKKMYTEWVYIPLLLILCARSFLCIQFQAPAALSPVSIQ